MRSNEPVSSGCRGQTGRPMLVEQRNDFLRDSAFRSFRVECSRDVFISDYSFGYHYDRVDQLTLAMHNSLTSVMRQSGFHGMAFFFVLHHPSTSGAELWRKFRGAAWCRSRPSRSCVAAKSRSMLGLQQRARARRRTRLRQSREFGDEIQSLANVRHTAAKTAWASSLDRFHKRSERDRSAQRDRVKASVAQHQLGHCRGQRILVALDRATSCQPFPFRDLLHSPQIEQNTQCDLARSTFLVDLRLMTLPAVPDRVKRRRNHLVEDHTSRMLGKV